jgi:hypothetical protein
MEGLPIAPTQAQVDLIAQDKQNAEATERAAYVKEQREKELENICKQIDFALKHGKNHCWMSISYADNNRLQKDVEAALREKGYTVNYPRLLFGNQEVQVTIGWGSYNHNHTRDCDDY